VVKRIHVTYRVQLEDEADRDKVQRAFDHHMPRCPIYVSIRAAIDVTTSIELELDSG
jgi:uncharacterized OsmC-like protein